MELINSQQGVPIEQRPFFVFVRDVLVEQLSVTPLKQIELYSVDTPHIFDTYTENSTLHHAMKNARTYAYTFKNSFNMSYHDDDLDYKLFVKNPKQCFTEQVVRCAVNLCNRTMTKHGAQTIKPSLLIQTLNEYDASDLDSILYNYSDFSGDKLNDIRKKEANVRNFVNAVNSLKSDELTL